MMTEYHGDPVAGGTFPAEIWHAFMEKALAVPARTQPESFPSHLHPVRLAATRSSSATGRSQLDNGHCHFARNLLFFDGQEPSKTANCKPNEVDVPDLIGQPVQAARARLAGQPLTPSIVYKAAKAGREAERRARPEAEQGALSAYDHVTLVVAKPTHGVVPQLIGLPVGAGAAEVRAARAEGRRRADGQGPAGARASSSCRGRVSRRRPGCTSGSRSRPDRSAEVRRVGLAVAPRDLGGLRDSDARADAISDVTGRVERERRFVEREPVVLAGESQAPA